MAWMFNANITQIDIFFQQYDITIKFTLWPGTIFVPVLYPLLQRFALLSCIQTLGISFFCCYFKLESCHSNQAFVSTTVWVPTYNPCFRRSWHRCTETLWQVSLQVLNGSMSRPRRNLSALLIVTYNLCLLLHATAVHCRWLVCQ